ncbi:EGF, latrophilin and seven transmembrane domain-containing protein [Echinococcus granulosus]|uniref:EGF, latrophilin and seven transmembrane domain-containing protein n=1 Tax=Echinococcus granulosus TaxID=6210 RepID=W6UA03_ECHGR|nr:EGF, latrophilin and seven transmembrane domain-containing protein [Echinococcus granulosus]EUB57351.1 EGF, latrophilin and seven transmembrane domain-containing protein [Echinococcus granulosus]
MVIAKSVVVHIVFIVCINFVAFAVQDIDRISGNFFRKTYRRWNNRPLELHCPFSNPSHQLWYSSDAVYKAAFGCLDGADLSLFLPVFPDVDNITFIGLNTSHQALCTFRLTGELVEGDALLLSSRSNDNGRFEVKIFARPGASLTFNTTICKTPIWTNVRQQLRSQFNCAVESVKTSFPAIDAQMTATQSLVVHYYPPSSVELDGIGTCELTANEGHHFCPLGAMDCIESPYGPKCRSELQVSLVEASSKMGFNGVPNSGSQYSKGPPVDLNLLLRKVSTDKNLTYLVQKSGPLLWQNSERWIGTLGNVTKENFQRTSSTLFEERDEVSSENLLQSIEALLNMQTQRQAAAESSYPKSGQSFTEESPVTASAVVQSASALLNVFSALSGDQDSPGFAINTADEYTIQRNGLELRRIRLNKNQSDTQNESIVMHSLATSSVDSSTALMITIPMRKLEPFLKKSNDSEFTKVNTSLGDVSFTNLDSDVYIIHTSDLISLFQLKMAYKKSANFLRNIGTDKNSDVPTASITRHHKCENEEKLERKEDVTCRIWDMLNAQGNAFESQTCQTYWIDGKYYECRCTPSRSGTFAVGLVYIMSSKDLKNLKNYGPSITIVNYVSSVITVIALSLFLFFTRFVGVFRLDQFHIALSLLLGTLVSLFIPHVPEDFEFLCAVIAVLVNYFPLCAFAWKVAPHTDFNGIFALRIVYIPVTICAYIGPALIVGLWFGMARQFKSGLGLCIGPDLLGYRWPLLAPITAVVLFNLLVLITVGFVVLRNYLAIRRSRVNKSTHLLVLAQLMLTLGIPYMLIYIQIISPVFMLLILPMGIALTAVFMFLLVAVIDDENRQLLHIFLTTMCSSGHHVNKYSGNGSNGRVNIADTIKSTTLPSPDAFVVTDSGHHNHMTTSSSANNSTNHEYFARSRSRFAMEGDLATGILRQPISDGGSGVGDEFKSAAVLVPLEVAQLPTQYYYNPQSPHHNAPVIRFESLHDLVMAPTSEFNDVGRIIQTPMPEVAYSEGIGTQHFYPKSRKQFVNKITTSPKLVNSYHMDSKSGGF